MTHIHVTQSLINPPFLAPIMKKKIKKIIHNLVISKTSVHVAHHFNTDCGRVFHLLYTVPDSRMFQKDNVNIIDTETF